MGYAASWNASRDGEFGPSYGLQASQAPQGDLSINGRADYQGRHGLYQVYVDQVGERRNVLGTVSGGVVVGAGRVFFTQPLSGGLALLRSPRTPGIEGLRENTPVGKTDKRGDLFIRGFTPYYPSAIGLDTDAMPIDVSPGDVASKTFMPTERTLSVVEFNAAPVVSVQATLQWAGGQAVRYGALTVERNGVPEEISLGADGMFYAENLAPGTYEGKLSTSQGSGVCKFTVPADQTSFTELGTIECQKIEAAP